MKSFPSDTSGSGPDDPPGRRRGRDRRRTPPIGEERRGRRGREDRRPSFGGGRLDFSPPPITFVEDRELDGGLGLFRPERKVDVGAILAGLFGIGTVAFVAVLLYRGSQIDIDHDGIEDGAALNEAEAAELAVTLDLRSAERASSATLLLDGEEVEEPEVDGEVIRWAPAEELAEGDHTLQLNVPRPVIGDAEFRWDFEVDHTPPTLEVPTVVDPVAIDEGATVEGTVEEGSTVTADGREVEVDDGNTFTLSFGRAPAGPVSVVATDRAGNSTTVAMIVPVRYPESRAVHMTAASWTSPVLRGDVYRLLDEGRIDTVVIDLKDRTGTVGYDTQVDRAHQIGAVTPHYDLEDMVAAVESHGGRVVGRIVAFQDPMLAGAAWGAGQGDQVIQAPDGQPYEGGTFTNFSHAAVRQYNIDIALDAAGRGVHDILWDDVRKPGSPEDTMLVPGLVGSPEDAVVGFLAEAHAQLRRRGTFQGVITVGIAATNGETVAQNVSRMARNTDYLVPTIHPVYWSSGSFGVPNPGGQPYDLVFRALERYQQLTEGSGVVLAPSLQDFSVGGRTYGDAEVRAQVDAARARQVTSFVLFDPNIRYSGGALDPAG